jgi:hypothetical protein
MAALIDDGIKFSSDTPRADRGARSSVPKLHAPALCLLEGGHIQR